MEIKKDRIAEKNFTLRSYGSVYLQKCQSHFVCIDFYCIEYAIRYRFKMRRRLYDRFAPYDTHVNVHFASQYSQISQDFLTNTTLKTLK